MDRLRTALLALLICLPFSGIGTAQADTNIHDAWGTNTHSNNSGCNNPYNRDCVPYLKYNQNLNGKIS
jgi:hypothetical protein